MAFSQDYEEFTIKSAHKEATFKISLKYTPEQRELIKSDLQALANIPKKGGGSKLHRKFFKGNISGDTYLKWLSQRIEKINYPDDFEREDWIASNERAGNKTISFYTSHFKRNDQNARLSTYIHEGRHSDKEDVEGHTLCNEIPKQEKPFSLWQQVNEQGYTKDVCDEGKYGAFFYQLVFNANLFGIDRNSETLDSSIISPLIGIARSDSQQEFLEDTDLICPAKDYLGIIDRGWVKMVKKVLMHNFNKEEQEIIPKLIYASGDDKMIKLLERSKWDQALVQKGACYYPVCDLLTSAPMSRVKKIMKNCPLSKYSETNLSFKNLFGFFMRQCQERPDLEKMKYFVKEWGVQPDYELNSRGDEKERKRSFSDILKERFPDEEYIKGYNKLKN